MAEGKIRSWDMKKFFWEGVHRIVLALEDLDKPIIAAINGAAMGAGWTWPSCVTSGSAPTERNYPNLTSDGGRAGGWGGLFSPETNGNRESPGVLLTGNVITAKEALEIGLVNRVVPHEQLMEETLSFAKKIASKPPLASRMIKRAVYQAQTSNLRSHLDYISSQLALLSETRDHQEAASAFLEKENLISKANRVLSSLVAAKGLLWDRHEDF